jgi:hypothetical protein
VTRERVDDALQRIEAARDGLEHYLGQVELPDDHTEALAATRELVARVLH